MLPSAPMRPGMLGQMPHEPMMPEQPVDASGLNATTMLQAAKTDFLIKFLDDSAWFCLEKLKNMFFLLNPKP